MALELNGPQRRKLRDALVAAFPGYQVLTRMVADQLDENLQTISSSYNEYEHVVFELIEWAGARGILDRLLMGALAANRGRDAYSGNPALLRFAQDIGLSATDATKATLEKVVSGNTTFLDVARWRAELARNEFRVCRVDLDGRGKGTGFLVGPDLVLTNYHVVEGAIDGSLSPRSMTCRFDYKVTTDGSIVASGVVEELAADWLVDHAKYSAVDGLPDPKPRDPDASELDYALMRLASRVGEQPPRGAGGAEPRGWIPLRREAADFASQSVVAILQHPQTLPLKLALGFEQRIQVNGTGNRIRHTVPTEPGSSGSPLFDSDWRVVALHHSGDPRKIKPEYNEAIPIALIAAQPKIAEALPEDED